VRAISKSTNHSKLRMAMEFIVIAAITGFIVYVAFK